MDLGLLSLQLARLSLGMRPRTAYRVLADAAAQYCSECIVGGDKTVNPRVHCKMSVFLCCRQTPRSIIPCLSFRQKSKVCFKNRVRSQTGAQKVCKVDNI